MTTKATRPMVRIHDTTTDEIIDRQMNDEEFAQHEQMQQVHATLMAEAEAKALAKQESLAKLESLGLTADDLKNLIG